MADVQTARNWRDLIKPRSLSIEGDAGTGTFGKFIAEPLEQFAEWQRQQLLPASPPTQADTVRGAAIFGSMACVSCHAIGGAVANEKARYAPDLTHLGDRKTLGAGILTNTSAELGRWLRNPQEIKTGCHMPDTQLSDQQVRDLVAYLESPR